MKGQRKTLNLVSKLELYQGRAGPFSYCVVDLDDSQVLAQHQT
jgi:hypothetical protein